MFRCFADSPQAVYYRASLHGTGSTNSSELIVILKQWIAEGAAIVIQRILLSVDDSCDVVISSLFTDVQCPQKATTEPTQIESQSSPPVAIIGGSAATVVVVIVLVITMLIIITVVFKKKHKNNINSPPEIK